MAERVIQAIDDDDRVVIIRWNETGYYINIEDGYVTVSKELCTDDDAPCDWDKWGDDEYPSVEAAIQDIVDNSSLDHPVQYKGVIYRERG